MTIKALNLFSPPNKPFHIFSFFRTISTKQQTFFGLFKRCTTMQHTKQVHARIILSGTHRNLFVMGKIIVFCAVSNFGNMDYAVSVFSNLRRPDGFLWNTMIRGFSRTNEPVKAFAYYKKMQEVKMSADNFTFSFLLKVCGQLGSYWLGRQLHCECVKHGFETHVFVRNTLIHMYGMFKDIEISCRLFEEIPDPELVAWNIIIDCNVYCGKPKVALDFFMRMLRGNVEPDDATLVAALSACSALGALDFGRWIHSCAAETGLGEIVCVGNSLIDMYAKCGAVEEALRSFNEMKERNLVTWNTIISGLAMHGHGADALELFSTMLGEKRERPDDLTFLGVLWACSHGGMVEEGRRYFDSMIKDYNIRPTIKHYGCMVDVLGRAGFVDEAYELIMSMPMECNAIVWRTLLAACRVHGNVELGEKVRRHLLEIEPDHSSDFVLLANTYAHAGQWKEMVRERKLMQEKGVQKPTPGNSMVGSHPRLKLDVKNH